MFHGTKGSILHPLQESRDVFWRPDIFHRHRQEFADRVAIMMDGSFVHGEKAKSLDIEHPHWMWVGMKQHAVLIFGFP